MKKLTLSLAIAALAVASTANADLLLDRGLPTDNLNNASGANRSNVAWAFASYTSGNYWLVGDSFTNTGPYNWYVDSIRLWTVGRTDQAVLRGGVAGETVGVISDVTYGDPAASTYQGSGGGMIAMHLVEFAVNLVIGAGQTYNFFLDGVGQHEPGIYVPFVHASNAALSGSPQQGADDLMLYANVVNGVVDPLSIGTWTSLGDGWDKASDVNVQVYGRVPEPTTLGLLGLALVAVARRARKA